MKATGRRLGEVEPRERAGAQTGRRYEYQYEQTALAALEILEVPEHVCVHCDWHDDYVVEKADGVLPSYAFHQVKSKDASHAPWKLRELFGMVFPLPVKPEASKKKKAKNAAPVKVRNADTKSPIPRMLAHRGSFGPYCGELVFVTNCGLDAAAETFLQALRDAPTIDDLPDDAADAIAALAAAYSAADPPLNLGPNDLFEAIRAVRFEIERGSLANPDLALLEIGQKISRTSEVNLQIHESAQVARGIVDVVRRKVGFTKTIVPAADEVLRSEKGVVVLDLLDVLALSRDGYEQLAKTGVDRDTVKTLSRLERFCAQSQVWQPFVVKICGFKAQWDVWRTSERHVLDTVDYLHLESKARTLLQANLSLEDLAEASKALAASFSKTSSAAPISPEQVLGLVFALAAQSEARR